MTIKAFLKFLSTLDHLNAMQYVDFTIYPMFDIFYVNVIGTVVGKVEAIDPDPVMNPNSVIYFSLLSNQGDTGPFSINSTNVSNL